MRALPLLLLPLLLLASTAVLVQVQAAESFEEGLTLRRLPVAAAGGGAAALARFEFAARLNATSAGAALHTEIFPVAMVQLLQAHRLSELRLSMSSGFWAEGWGGSASVPPGVALMIDTPDGAAAEDSWTGASSAVSGLFCPALAALRYEDTVTPRVFGGSSTRLYAAKPQEVMCRDHLGSFTQLLPCGAARSSLASTLAHALTLSNSQFLAVELALTAKPGVDKTAYSMSLVVSVVLQRTSQLGNVALSRTPGADVRELQGSFFSIAEPEEAVLPACCLCQLPAAKSQVVLRLADGSSQAQPSVFRLMPAFASTSESSIESNQQRVPPGDMNRDFGRALRAFWDAGAAQLVSADRAQAPTLTGFVAGPVNSYRTLILQQTVTNPSAHKELLVVLWQPIPSVLELTMSTLKAAVVSDGTTSWQAVTTPILLANAQSASKTVSNSTGAGAPAQHRFGMMAAWLQPSRRIGRGGPTGDDDATAGPRRSPSSLELVLRLPPSSTATVSVSAERSFLSFTDFPPDAARGTDISAPAAAYYYSEVGGASPGSPVAQAELLADMEPDGVVYAAAGMLVPVAWPDFSMPYNVICISCTIPMMVFGAISSGTLSNPVVGGHKPRPVHAFILWFLRTCDLLFGG